MAALEVEDAKAISKVDREEGLSILSSCLDMDDCDEEENFQQSILLDYLYDSLMFPVQRGFCWRDVCLLFNLAKEMQEETVGRPITDAVKLYKEKLQHLSTSVSERSLKIFSEYFFDSFMSHYKLFQYCFTREQDQMMLQYDLPVDAPKIPEPLKTATASRIWDYEQKLRDIEIAEAERRNERLVERGKVVTDDDEMMEKAAEAYESDPETPRNLDRDGLKEIIKEVTSAHVTAATHRIRCNIEDAQEDLEFKLQKTSLPRPQALGPPSRYKPKTPITNKQLANVSKADKPRSPRSPKSPKSGKSRSSSRAGKGKA